jgi:hypothetical protein
MCTVFCVFLELPLIFSTSSALLLIIILLNEKAKLITLSTIIVFVFYCVKQAQIQHSPLKTAAVTANERKVKEAYVKEKCTKNTFCHNKLCRQAIFLF